MPHWPIVARADNRPGDGGSDPYPDDRHRQRRAVSLLDLVTSLNFWVTLCGFDILYDRPENGFVYLHSGTSHVMLDQIGVGRDWITGPLEMPLGRGVNFQVSVPAIEPVVEHLLSSGWPLFLTPETKWYQTGGTQTGVSQFLAQDPDGYLVRFTSPPHVT